MAAPLEFARFCLKVKFEFCCTLIADKPVRERAAPKSPELFSKRTTESGANIAVDVAMRNAVPLLPLKVVSPANCIVYVVERNTPFPTRYCSAD